MSKISRFFGSKKSKDSKKDPKSKDPSESLQDDEINITRPHKDRNLSMSRSGRTKMKKQRASILTEGQVFEAPDKSSGACRSSNPNPTTAGSWGKNNQGLYGSQGRQSQAAGV